MTWRQYWDRLWLWLYDGQAPAPAYETVTVASRDRTLRGKARRRARQGRSS